MEKRWWEQYGIGLVGVWEKVVVGIPDKVDGLDEFETGC